MKSKNLFYWAAIGFTVLVILASPSQGRGAGPGDGTIDERFGTFGGDRLGGFGSQHLGMMWYRESNAHFCNPNDLNDPGCKGVTEFAFHPDHLPPKGMKKMWTVGLIDCRTDFADIMDPITKDNLGLKLIDTAFEEIGRFGTAWHFLDLLVLQPDLEDLATLIYQNMAPEIEALWNDRKDLIEQKLDQIIRQRLSEGLSGYQFGINFWNTNLELPDLPKMAFDFSGENDPRFSAEVTVEWGLDFWNPGLFLFASVDGESTMRLVITFEVDLIDLALVQSCLGPTADNNPACTIADIAPFPDGDEIVDNLDVKYVESHGGGTYITLADVDIDFKTTVKKAEGAIYFVEFFFRNETQEIFDRSIDPEAETEIKSTIETAINDIGRTCYLPLVGTGIEVPTQAQVLLAIFEREKLAIQQLINKQGVKGQYWEIGNEPNWYPYISPEIYAEHYARYYNLIKGLDSSAKILNGGLFVPELVQGIDALIQARLDPEFSGFIPILANMIDELLVQFSTEEWYSRFLVHLPESVHVDVGNFHAYPVNMTAEIDWNYVKHKMDHVVTFLTAPEETTEVWVTEFGNADWRTSEVYTAKMIPQFLDYFKSKVDIVKWFWFRAAPCYSHVPSGLKPPTSLFAPRFSVDSPLPVEMACAWPHEQPTLSPIGAVYQAEYLGMKNYAFIGNLFIAITPAVEGSLSGAFINDGAGTPRFNIQISHPVCEYSVQIATSKELFYLTHNRTNQNFFDSGPLTVDPPPELLPSFRVCTNPNFYCIYAPADPSGRAGLCENQNTKEVYLMWDVEGDGPFEFLEYGVEQTKPGWGGYDWKYIGWDFDGDGVWDKICPYCNASGTDWLGKFEFTIPAEFWESAKIDQEIYFRLGITANPCWLRPPRTYLTFSDEEYEKAPFLRITYPGDLTGDGCVDRNDYYIMINDIRNETLYNPSYDLNGDGEVNIADARKLVTLFTNPRGTPCE